MARRKPRSAIVPAIVFSAAVAAGAAVVPQIAGCENEPTMPGFMLDVAYVGFDMARRDLSAIAVADLGFDLGRGD